MTSPGGVQLADSNLANYGSNEHKEAKLDAAKSEKEFKGAGERAGVEVWRVENHNATAGHGPRFGVRRWPKKDYGIFYNGDSFIVLSTYKDNESQKLHHDIYYWLGSESSEDELGVAAYKTVELDDLLGGEPHEHRVTEGHESTAFRKLFQRPLLILSGGIASGFNHVKPHEYKPRLLWVKGSKTLNNVRVMQIEPKATLMNHSDCFILDTGLKLYQFNGKTSGMWEKEKARECVVEIRSDRNGKPTLEVLDDDGHDGGGFWAEIHGKPTDLMEEGPPDAEVRPRQRALFRCSDKSGKVKFTKVAQGALKSSMLDSKDVWIVDAGIEIFVWVGKKASKQERQQAMPLLESFMKQTNIDHFTPVSKVIEGARTLPGKFTEAFSGIGVNGEETEFTKTANSCCVMM